ncbi:MAG: helix-turn-helix domain-containing protein [Verrucomicrobiota bacterium]
MSISKNISDIVEADLQALIQNTTQESKTLEYKRQLNLSTDLSKLEFLKDVSAFANSGGGDIVYGIDSQDGQPLAPLQPLTNFNPDQTPLQLRDLILNNIEPKIFGVHCQPVRLVDGFALVIRIPKTWNGAHIVTFNNDNRFYVRDGAGKRVMEIDEIRTAFTLADTTNEKIRKFRLERMGHILADETPVLLCQSALIVLHLIPLKAFDVSHRYDMAFLIENCQDTKPIRHDSGYSPDRDFDGFYSYSRESNEQGKHFGYAYVLRTGVIEAVDATILYPRENGKYIPSQGYEMRIIAALKNYLETLKKLNSECPIIVALSLLNVKGYKMAVNPQHESSHSKPINRDHLLIHETVVDSFETDSSHVLRPLFDSIWNACGWVRSINYDQNGNRCRKT